MSLDTYQINGGLRSPDFSQIPRGTCGRISLAAIAAIIQIMCCSPLESPAGLDSPGLYPEWPDCIACPGSPAGISWYVVRSKV